MFYTPNRFSHESNDCKNPCCGMDYLYSSQCKLAPPLPYIHYIPSHTAFAWSPEPSMRLIRLG